MVFGVLAEHRFPARCRPEGTRALPNSNDTPKFKLSFRRARETHLLREILWLSANGAVSIGSLGPRPQKYETSTDRALKARLMASVLHCIQHEVIAKRHMGRMATEPRATIGI